MGRKKKRTSLQAEVFHSTLDSYFEAYQRGEFPSDEELTEWSLR